jgi:hypothetical protein
MVALKTEGEWRYRAAIYFAVATLHFYRDEILPLTPQQTLGDFADANYEVINRVCQESKRYLNYELSHEQIGRAIQAWVADPCKLNEEPQPAPDDQPNPSPPPVSP